MTTTRYSAPTGLFAALGVAGFAGVAAATDRPWHLAASAVMALLLIGLDVEQYRRRRR